MLSVRLIKQEAWRYVKAERSRDRQRERERERRASNMERVRETGMNAGSPYPR